MWFEMEFKNQIFFPWAHLPLYMGMGVGTLAGCANPIILPDLHFTLEMATFKLVTQHIARIFIFNIRSINKVQNMPNKPWGLEYALTYMNMSNCAMILKIPEPAEIYSHVYKNLSICLML